MTPNPEPHKYYNTFDNAEVKLIYSLLRTAIPSTATAAMAAVMCSNMTVVLVVVAMRGEREGVELGRERDGMKMEREEVEVSE